jgi:hypothetical protein
MDNTSLNFLPFFHFKINDSFSATVTCISITNFWYRLIKSMLLLLLWICESFLTFIFSSKAFSTSCKSYGCLAPCTFCPFQLHLQLSLVVQQHNWKTEHYLSHLKITHIIYFIVPYMCNAYAVHSLSLTTITFTITRLFLLTAIK